MLHARSSKLPPTADLSIAPLTVTAAVASASGPSAALVSPPSSSSVASFPRRFTPPPQRSASQRHPYAVDTARQQSAEAIAAAAQRATSKRIIHQGFQIWLKKTRSFLTLTLGDAKYESAEVQEELKRTQNISVSKAMGFGFTGWNEYRNVPAVDRPDKKNGAKSRR